MSVTTKEAAKRLNLSIRRVQQFAENGKLKATKEGRDWIISESDLKKFADTPRKNGAPFKKDETQNEN